MVKSKLIQLLRTLTVAEMREFGRYLEWASFRKSGAVFKLYNYLLKAHPEFLEKKIAKDVVYKKVIGDGKEVGQRFYDLMSILNTSLEDYLVNRKLEEKQTEKEFLLLEVLKERKLDKLFFQKISNIEKKWEKKPQAGIRQLQYEYQLLESFLHHPNHTLFSGDTSIDRKLLKKADQHYLAFKFYHILTLYSKEKTLTINSENQAKFFKEQFLLEDILSLIKDEDFIDYPNIILLKNILVSSINNDHSDFDRIKNSYYENLDLFAPNEQVDLYSMIQLICVENYSRGDQKFLRELFQLYDFNLRKGILVEDGYINLLRFRQIVHVSCALKELDWTRKFLDEYGSCLEEAAREDALKLCYALVDFNEQKYEKVINTFLTVKFQDPVYAIQTRCLLLQCYFELDEYEDQFFNLVKSFTVFLSRNQTFSEGLIEPTRKFVKYTNKLKIAATDPNIDKRNLKEEIEGLVLVSSKVWLLEKAKEL